MKIGVWPKVGFQAFFTAGQAWRTPQPLQIKSVELNWVKGRTSHEPNWLNWVRLMWSTAFDAGFSVIIITLCHTVFTYCGETMRNDFQVQCKLATVKRFHSIRSDEGLTLETSAFESLYGGQFTLSTSLMKPNYLVILPPTQQLTPFIDFQVRWFLFTYYKALAKIIWFLRFIVFPCSFTVPSFSVSSYCITVLFRCTLKAQIMHV